MVVQFLPELIGVPGGAGVTSGTVANPPGDADASLQLLLEAGEVPCQFKAGNVAGRVVGGSVVPGIDMPCDEDEIVTGILTLCQPVSVTDLSVAGTLPFPRAARMRLPSALVTVMIGMVGTRSWTSGVGVPHTFVTMPSCSTSSSLGHICT